MSDDLNIVREQQGARDGGSGELPSFTRKVADNRRVGRSGVKISRADVFGYDRDEGRQKALGIGTDVADRMSPEKVKETIARIHEAFGIARVNEGYLYAFDRALLICHALNGASQLMPSDRVSFYVVDGSRVDDYSYNTVHQLLGVDLRRFFRGIADETVDACKHLYYNYDPNNSREAELRAMMCALADKRAIARFPYLLADSADAALNLSPYEMTVLIESKRSVIGRTPNSVDSRNLAVPIRSSDNFDSSNIKNISSSNDIHANSQYYN